MKKKNYLKPKVRVVRMHTSVLCVSFNAESEGMGEPEVQEPPMVEGYQETFFDW